MKRWTGLKDLLFDVFQKTTLLVQENQESVARKVYSAVQVVEPLAKPTEIVETIHKSTTQLVYKGIFATKDIIKEVFDTGERIAIATAINSDDELKKESPNPMRSDAAGTVPWLRDMSLGALNGIVGDYLAAENNALEVSMSLRRDGKYLELTPESLCEELPESSSKVCIFIHGLACTEWWWSSFAEKQYGDPTVNYGKLLEQELGYTSIYLRYNSGLHISTNGALLAKALETLASSFPREIEEIVLIGHSMGGLVARSACFYAEQDEFAWVKKLKHVFSSTFHWRYMG